VDETFAIFPLGRMRIKYKGNINMGIFGMSYEKRRYT
jgi:hypothetical protein